MAVRAILLALVATTLACRTEDAQRLSRATPAAEAIDALATRLFALEAAPGMGVVVVRDTQIIHARGFGFADAETRRPFTTETEFYIASATKAFTGLALAMLDLNSVINLDAPITRYLPGVPLRAPVNAESVTVRHLLTHTHGIADGPVDIRLAYTGEYSSNAELIALLAEHGGSPAGRAFSYGNIGYNVAGLAMDTVLGESWKKALERLVLAPLRMTKTGAYVSGRSRERLAVGYLATGDGFSRAPYTKTDATMHTAGGLMTTLTDMGAWLEAQINAGRLDGRQVLPPQAVKETQRLQVTTPGSSRPGTVVGYGLGWRVGLRGGDTVLSHGGGFMGFATHVSFMPHRRFGVVVMANEARLGGAMAEVLADAVYDILTGVARNDDDTVARLARLLLNERRRLAADRNRLASRRRTLPDPLQAYSGRFHDRGMGHLEIVSRDGTLELRLGIARSAMKVLDGTRNQFRVAPFGENLVATIIMKGGRAVAVVLDGTTFSRVTPSRTGTSRP
jgi:CubicO group peptidase (beta-lactamase class C family)